MNRVSTRSLSMFQISSWKQGLHIFSLSIRKKKNGFLAFWRGHGPLDYSRQVLCEFRGIPVQAYVDRQGYGTSYRLFFCQINIFCPHLLTQNTTTDFVRFTKIYYLHKLFCWNSKHTSFASFEIQNNFWKSL